MYNKNGYSAYWPSEPTSPVTEPAALLPEAPQNNEGGAFPPAPPKEPKKKHGILKIIALCLCCALLGGMFGGAAALYFSPANSGEEAKTASSALDIVVGSGAGAKSTPVSSTGRTLSDIYEASTPSVVGIAVEGTETNVFGQRSHIASSGSGFIVSKDGYILTNNHVVEGANSVTVRVNDNKSYSAKIVGTDPQTDVAVIKIEATDLTPVTFGDSAKLKVGDTVLAIGNPLGEFVNSLTVGVVSALDRDLNIDGTPLNVLQTDAAINPGNSGGPLFNLSGEVVGITTAKSAGSGVEGIGFAIPINDVVKTMELLIENGYDKGRAMLGISIYEVDEDMSETSGIPVGVYVSSVAAGSCAEKAGIQKGDIVTALGDKEIVTTNDLYDAKRTFSAGDTTTIKVLRNGETLSLKITFDEETQQTAAQAPQVDDGSQPGDQGGSGGTFDFGDFFPGFGR